ncbi:MAG: hypothetical protein A2W19_03620 [Spirochaetes bacterium RBG_16_49_21]|nr:MAG: hypothetical protein A2W19_03620 [Spirochaetes bacterium RBG_16_49_21]
MKNLDTLFYPDSIAVIGAGEASLKWGSIIITNILDGGFKGRVYPVSSSRDTIYGLKAYKSVTEIPERVDLAYIATPASTVMGILADCAGKDIRNVVVISSGFSEAGAGGVLIEKQLIDFAAGHSINIVGPNTMGMSNLRWGLHGTGAHPRPAIGGISIIAQSGNVGNQIMLWAELEKIGISKFVGSGNEAVLKVEDFLEYFNRDADTRVILLYLEGVDDGRRFLDIAKSTCLKKPVIALKAGRTEGGGRAAHSHTGAMAGSFNIFEAVMKQTGITIAMNPTELLELAAVFDSFPLPRGNRVGIITLGGGWGVITADECEERGLDLPPLPESLKRLFDSKLPAFWSRSNPVDLVGQPDHAFFKEAIEVMVSSDAYDAIIVLGLIGAAKFGIRPIKSAHRMGFLPNEELRRYENMSREIDKQILDVILALMSKYDKPIYPVSLAAFPDDEMTYTKEGSRYKAIVYKTPEMAALCLSKQYRYRRFLQTHGK